MFMLKTRLTPCHGDKSFEEAVAAQQKMDIVASLNHGKSLRFVISTRADNHRYFKADEAALDPDYRTYTLDLVRVAFVPPNKRVRLGRTLTPNKAHGGGWVWEVHDAWRNVGRLLDKGNFPVDFLDVLEKWNVAAGWYGLELMARMKVQKERKELLASARETGAAEALIEGTL